jgi:hypothetical protein
MATIIQTGEKTFTTDNGKGTTLTLKWNTRLDRWEVFADNAAVRAYRSLGVKIFATLADVETRYKTFRGVSALIG